MLDGAAVPAAVASQGKGGRTKASEAAVEHARQTAADSRRIHACIVPAENECPLRCRACYRIHQ